MSGFKSRKDRGWYYHFREGGYEDIYFVDIFYDDEQHRKLILEQIRTIHLPGEEIQGGFRIYGYARPGQELAYL